MVNVAIQSKILKTLSIVPSGFVVSYGQLADLAGLPGKARLVGKCLKDSDATTRWHRVIRSDGKIAFPAGSELAEEQRSLLVSEGVVVKNHRVNMKVYGWKPSLYTLLAELEK
ncbi:MGMT family protein [Alteromonas stellipolaris]|jgi:methylated-DNA-protein-cysteine methyltransferase-like protein|uniref:MGMT family protein n=1 Tax=Alteromonas stellipolaris TaxID=233316 RepID=A0AAW7YY29_9ALTE|nr:MULTISPECIES: MGMT family protein [Alteromonas]AMJ92484.1 cysteine methyltransferase [Alteromonas sp. Mac2]AMJ88628.1 cysteine methyltransferase [Alteromonas sp. Mac1]AMJ96334.1 cysteine methyltransferase [Alteromonas stellipolaris]ANB25473.1 cysteine methyltransferase [Alteromonas stellipolaris]MBZ2160874.1 MGMT family protein [Alteromonas stellipolaris]